MSRPRALHLDADTWREWWREIVVGLGTGVAALLGGRKLGRREREESDADRIVSELRRLGDRLESDGKETRKALHARLDGISRDVDEARREIMGRIP